MASTTPIRSQPLPHLSGTWSKSLAQPGVEFGPVNLPVVFGAIPSGLRGTFYCNGPGRLERGGQRFNHWFDGDGAVLAVHFTFAGATGVYRYVQTEGYQAETNADKILFANYGTIPPGSLWQRYSCSLKNAANTSVLALPDKLLALWEGGNPYALDLQTLETYGLDDLQGLQGRGMADGLPFSAHPKTDPQTGEIYNFGVDFGMGPQIHLYQSDATGRIQRHALIPLPMRSWPVIHDFVLAGPYLIFFIPPVRANLLPLLLRLQSYSEALQWRPELGTHILVIDRETFTVVSQGEAPAWYQWHFANGFVDNDGRVIVDLIRYEDWQTNQYLQEVSTGNAHTLAPGALWRIHLDPNSSKVEATYPLVERRCEFPVIHPQQMGQPYRYVYFSLHRQDAPPPSEYAGAIARFDHQTQTLMEADLGRHRYVAEPIYAPDADDPDRGWIITDVFDGDRDCSEVWVWDADRLDEAPVCRLALPEIVPLPFHGTWKPAYSSLPG